MGTNLDGVADGGGWGGEGILAPTEYEWGIRRVGRNHVSVWDALVFGFFEQMGRACLKVGEVQTLPPLKFRTYCGSG